MRGPTTRHGSFSSRPPTQCALVLCNELRAFVQIIKVSARQFLAPSATDEPGLQNGLGRHVTIDGRGWERADFKEIGVNREKLPIRPQRRM